MQRISSSLRSSQLPERREPSNFVLPPYGDGYIHLSQPSNSAVEQLRQLIINIYLFVPLNSAVEQLRQLIINIYIFVPSNIAVEQLRQLIINIYLFVPLNSAVEQLGQHVWRRILLRQVWRVLLVKRISPVTQESHYCRDSNEKRIFRASLRSSYSSPLLIELFHA
eukprot:GHVL01002285.1.p1 GENE.GHVL01002285.1~~GHVL01002285.1.p1  ORF type:complete len:166 (-),score=10.18 GHVL01002285.1:156-653(-)